MAMSWIWAGMVTLSLLCGLCTGNLNAVAAAALSGAQSAVELSLSMAGILCLWSGVIRVMEAAGLSGGLSRLLRPLLRRLFPAAFRDPETAACLSGNFTANLLGLGNAATPLGLRAVQRMQALSGGTRATDEMCRLIVLNTASVQLLPATVAAVRAALGAPSPFDILPAVWLTSLCSVSAGLLAARLMEGRHG